MKILDISHNDDLRAVAQKCNLNFRQLAFSARDGTARQGRTNDRNIVIAVDAAVSELTSTTIPNEVAAQISGLEIPAQIGTEVANQLASQDIPGQVSSAVAAEDIHGQVATEVSAQMPGAFPPVGACMLMQADPSGSYPGTTWQQTDSVTTDTSVVIPLWERIA